MNRKIITATLAALTAASSLGAATAASAQSRGPAHAPAAHAAPAHAAPSRAVMARPTPPRAQAPAYGRWQQSQRRYSANRYAPPRGYQARSWSYGQRLPAQYRSRGYVVNNYSSYGLRAPPRGYEYVRTGNDVVLTAVATGLITAVIAGLFN